MIYNKRYIKEVFAMPPKIKITKEEIIRAGLDIVRREGESALNARSIAAVLGCSTQPVFSNYASMEELRRAVMVAAAERYSQYIVREVSAGTYPAYKASGIAYIRFAKEEKNLFKLLYMRDRGNREEPYETQMYGQMEGFVRDYTGLETDRAKLFHLEMWTFVHGIATMMATGYLQLDMDLVSKMLTDAYQGLRKQYGME
jgi:AcrR family transcriptional regulator